MAFAFPLLKNKLENAEISGIGHRVVHGGETFSSPTLINEVVEAEIDLLSKLAPLHNPINLAGIEIARTIWPNLPHVAVFDTAFHTTLPRRAKTYAISQELAEKYGIRRYGFHGTSHQFVAQKAADFLKFPLRELRLITCHLGNGASICAIEYGRSIETSMGMTPLEGLVMGTRSGDIDAGSLLFLMEKEGWSASHTDKYLNKQSGLVGITGDSDMQYIENRAAAGDDKARLGIQVFTHRLRKYIGAYAAVMGGVDAIIFTGGIGENSAVIRERTVQRFAFLGAILNEDANRDADIDAPDNIADISTSNSRCKLLVIPTDEQYEIAKQAAFVIEEKYAIKDDSLTIPVAVSARHIHLTQETVEQLFGKGYQLTEYKPLSQPGQFAANERVSLIGPKNTIERVRILGPTRPKNQVEISRTDEFYLGIDAPVRASGQTENSPGIKIQGPEGSVTIPDGVICAWRHIHMPPEDAQQFGVEDKDVVEVRVENDDRSLTFGNVLVRVSPKYKLEMHIDTDEGNAAELSRNSEGSILHTGEYARLTKKRRANG
ncbi:UNVERIFIED_CONTAM: hypothetical protein GTU68_012647 [Idotea baltica]|nr:hypothetical protein [Idotea baltica]